MKRRDEGRVDGWVDGWMCRSKVDVSYAMNYGWSLWKIRTLAWWVGGDASMDGGWWGGVCAMGARLCGYYAYLLVLTCSAG